MSLDPPDQDDENLDQFGFQQRSYPEGLNQNHLPMHYSAVQANTILEQPLNIVLIAIPLILQSYGIFIIAYFLAVKLKLKHNIAAPASLIGTSNFFEMAVAVAISLFGLHSGAALATVVGVLVEVPVMLSLVAIVNRTKHWFNE